MSNGPTANRTTNAEDLFSPRSTAAMALSSMMNSQPTSLDFEEPQQPPSLRHPDFHPPQNKLRKAPAPPPGKPHNKIKPPPPPPPPKEPKHIVVAGKDQATMDTNTTDASAAVEQTKKPLPDSSKATTDAIFRRPSPPLQPYPQPKLQQQQQQQQPIASSTKTTAPTHSLQQQQQQQVFRRPSPHGTQHASYPRGVTPSNNIRRYPYHYHHPPMAHLPPPWTPPTWDNHRQRPMPPVVYRTTTAYPPPVRVFFSLSVSLSSVYRLVNAVFSQTHLLPYIHLHSY